jgi:hypothetical protein
LTVQFERFAHCGHGVIADAETDAMAIIRQFIVAENVTSA